MDCSLIIRIVLEVGRQGSISTDAALHACGSPHAMDHRVRVLDARRPFVVTVNKYRGGVQGATCHRVKSTTADRRDQPAAYECLEEGVCLKAAL